MTTLLDETRINEADVQALTIAPKEALAINRAPDVVLDEARKAAKALTDVLGSKEKKITFNGKQYLQFEDWQTIARFYGMTAMVKHVHYVEFGEGDDKVKGFEATANALLVGTNQVISAADAMCLDDEANWSRKPLFQLRSMAQTRACAKALRNVLAWVVVLAGYAPTPAEEMEEASNGQQYVKPAQAKSQSVQAAPQTSGNGKSGKKVTEPQLNRLYAIAKQHSVSAEDFHRAAKEDFHVESLKDLTMAEYEKLIAWVEAQ